MVLIYQESSKVLSIYSISGTLTAPVKGEYLAFHLHKKS